MDYERIQKPNQGGGFSPSKLRSMLLGVEKRRKEEEELQSRFSLGPDSAEIDGMSVSTSESCKDVDIVSIQPDYSIMTEETLDSEMVRDPRGKDHSFTISRTKTHEDSWAEYDPSNAPSTFEFHKTDRIPNRFPVVPFSKPAPSKWDDAQKWIASPNLARPKGGQGQSQIHGLPLPRKSTHGNKQSSAKVVIEVSNQRTLAPEEDQSKGIEPDYIKKEIGEQKFVDWIPDPYPNTEAYGKSTILVEKIAPKAALSLSQHDTIVSINGAATFAAPPTTVRAVSMRDMGTEMTPVASQEPSRTGTPVRAASPMDSPTSSRPSTPRTAATSLAIGTDNYQVDSSQKELSEKEIQMRTRREIMVLGTQLGKTNIAAWASKEEEEKDASSSLKIAPVEQQPKFDIEAHATAWEEAEKTKYMARYKREEMKIQAWENHQKAKTEAELRKIEVEVEEMRARAHDKLMNKLAAAKQKAEEKRAAAEARKNKQGARIEEQAEYIRRRGRLPSLFCCGWCL